jgi:hypothetical protein
MRCVWLRNRCGKFHHGRWGERCEEPCAARPTAHTRALSHWRGPLLRCERTKSSGAAVDSDLRRGRIIWWAFRAGMDVEPALWPPHPRKPETRHPGNLGDRSRATGNSVAVGVKLLELCRNS